MALLPGTLSRAGPLSSDILDLQAAEHGADARVVTAVGEVDALTAPELAAFLIAQLVVAPVVVVNLDGVRFLSSAGLRALFEANEFASREDRDLRLVCNSQTANWALKTSGLWKHFTFTETCCVASVHARNGTNCPTRDNHTGAVVRLTTPVKRDDRNMVDDDF
ncbi:MAG: STAS domain-containing protein [Pseudonocardiaceae bacterium]